MKYDSGAEDTVDQTLLPPLFLVLKCMSNLPVVVEFPLQSGGVGALVTVEELGGVFALDVRLQILSPRGFKITLGTTNFLALFPQVNILH